MKTDRTQHDINEIRILISESCAVLVEASRLIWEGLDTDERAMLRGYVVTQEWELPQHPAVLQTFLRLEALGLLSHSEMTGGSVETTIFADAMVSIMDKEPSHGQG